MVSVVESLTRVTRLPASSELLRVAVPLAVGRFSVALGRVVLHDLRESATKCWASSVFVCGASAMVRRVQLLPGRMHCAAAARLSPKIYIFRDVGKKCVLDRGHAS